MHRLRFLLFATMVLALALSGCNRTPPAAQETVTDTPADSGQTDTANSGGGESFTPQTKHLISSGDVPLLEQINRENAKGGGIGHAEHRADHGDGGS